MDCHGPRLAVPCKQPVFKHTPHRDLGACIVSWLTQRHGAQFAARKREVADKLQTLRQAALQGDTSQAGCRALIGYFHCLSALGPALPFGTDEARGQLHVRFEWSSAYKQTERTKAYVPLLECVAVLFNAAASMSAQAAMEAGKRSSPESLKRQCNHFQTAAGIFMYIREELQFELESRGVGSPLTEDLSSAGLHALESLMLAQAQECFFESAQLNKMSPKVLAKVASGTAVAFATAAEYAAPSSRITEISRSVQPYALVQQLHYEAVAQLLLAEALIAEESEAIGEGIQRLRVRADIIGHARINM